MLVEKFDFVNFPGQYDYHWRIKSNVSMLIAPNGAGKTLMLETVYDYYSQQGVSTIFIDPVGHIKSNFCFEAFKPNNDSCVAYLKEAFLKCLERTKFDHLGFYVSDGIAKLANMVKAVEISPDNTLILFDLPETFLHIELQCHLIDICLSMLQDSNKQVIMAIHSPYIIYGHDDLIMDKGMFDKESGKEV